MFLYISVFYLCQLKDDRFLSATKQIEHTGATARNLFALYVIPSTSIMFPPFDRPTCGDPACSGDLAFVPLKGGYLSLNPSSLHAILMFPRRGAVSHFLSLPDGAKL